MLLGAVAPTLAGCIGCGGPHAYGVIWNQANVYDEMPREAPGYDIDIRSEGKSASTRRDNYLLTLYSYSSEKNEFLVSAPYEEPYPSSDRMQEYLVAVFKDLGLAAPAAKADDFGPRRECYL